MPAHDSNHHQHRSTATPEDFACAIGALRASFAGDVVMTAPDQLAAHSFRHILITLVCPYFCILVTSIMMLIVSRAST